MFARENIDEIVEEFRQFILSEVADFEWYKKIVLNLKNLVFFLSQV